MNAARTIIHSIAAVAKAKADEHKARMLACDKLPTWFGALACRFDSN